MIKTRYFVAAFAAIAAMGLAFSSVASAGSFSTWPSTRNDGSHGYVYFGPNGVHWGRVGAGHFGHHSYKYPYSGANYGCKNCFRGDNNYRYDRYDYRRY